MIDTLRANKLKFIINGSIKEVTFDEFSKKFMLFPHALTKDLTFIYPKPNFSMKALIINDNGDIIIRNF